MDTGPQGSELNNPGLERHPSKEGSSSVTIVVIPVCLLSFMTTIIVKHNLAYHIFMLCLPDSRNSQVEGAESKLVGGEGH